MFGVLETTLWLVGQVLKMIWGHPISKNHPLVHREWIIRSIIIHDGHSLWVVQWEYQNLNLAIALSNLEDFNQIGKSGHVHRIKLTTSSAKPARVTGSVVQTSFCCLTRDDGPCRLHLFRVWKIGDWPRNSGKNDKKHMDCVWQWVFP